MRKTQHFRSFVYQIIITYDPDLGFEIIKTSLVYYQLLNNKPQIKLRFENEINLSPLMIPGKYKVTLEEKLIKMLLLLHFKH